ncbi:MAG: terminase family protein [Bryobacteraceae bacterium]|nr:terminase family protein [Bryobacteraceae bacterium]
MHLFPGKTDPRCSGLYLLDPVSFALEVLGLTLMPFQVKALDPRVVQGLLNCSRQAGKTLAMAIKAVHLAFLLPDTVVAVLCPTARQAGEFFEKVRMLMTRLDVRVVGDGHNAISACFPNGSRIVGLPAGAKVRGVSAVNLLIVDEAAEVPDEAYHAVTPMLATTAGKGAGGQWLISTPMGKRGFFWQTWAEGGDGWTRLSVPASEIPRINPAWLESQRLAKGELRFRQEFCCEFLDTPDSLFREDFIRRAIRKEVPKLWAA